MIIELILTKSYTLVYDTKYFPISNFNTYYVCLQFGSFSFIIYCIHSLNLCLFYVITIHSNTLDQGFCDVGTLGIRVSSKDFCVVAKVAIIQKIIEPNLAT